MYPSGSSASLSSNAGGKVIVPVFINDRIEELKSSSVEQQQIKIQQKQQCFDSRTQSRAAWSCWVEHVQKRYGEL